MADTTQQQGNQQSAANQADEERRARELADKMGGMLKGGALNAGTGIKLVWHDPLLLAKLLDRLVDWARRTLPQELFNMVARFFARVGLVSLLAVAPVAVVFAVTAGIKQERFSLALYGLGFVILMIILQYVASKLMAAGEALTLASHTSMDSDAFLRCVALIAKVTGIAAVIYMTVVAIHFKEWSPFWTGIGVLLVCEALSFIALHPALASTSVIERSAAGEEAIGIISFFVKAAMRLVPIVFGLLSFGLFVLLIVATIQQLRDKTDWLEGMDLGTQMVKTALLPFAAYVGFALYCLTVELMRAILSIKGIAKKCGE